MDQSKENRKEVIQLDSFTSIGFGFEKCGQSCQGDGHGNQKLDDVWADLDHIECSQSQGKGMPDGESCNEDQNFPPISGNIHGTESQNK